MKREKFLLKAAIIGSIVLVAAVIAVMILMGESKNPEVYFAFLNILSGAYALLSVVTVLVLRRQMDIVGMVIILGNCVLSFGQLYFMDNRLYHQLLFALLAASILYLLFGLVSFWVHKRKERWYSARHLLSFILAPCFVGFSFLIKSAWMMKLIETELGKVSDIFAFAGLGCGAAALIAAIILIKDRRDRKEYFGKLSAAFFAPLLIVFAFPMLMSEQLNYALDTSAGVKTECVVVDKETRHTGSKGGTRYYLTVSADGKTVEMNTNKVIYAQYNAGDSIELYEHTGALGFTYYEYQFEEIYHYAE